MDEQQIISLCKKGDKKGQKILYDCFANYMFRVCLRYTGNYMDADDVVIMAFQKVFKNIDSFEYRGVKSLKRWVKTIMINESLMFLRRSRKNMFESIDNSHIQIADEVESDIDAELIYQLIMKLPDGYRTVVNLFIIDGMSHEEIAKQLGISESTSKSQLSRGRALLKNQLLKLESNER